MSGGRPKKEINYEQVEKLAAIMCTQEEIATFFDVHPSTLRRNPEFCTAYKKGQGVGKMSLRRIQVKLAEKNASMAIFLGKQYLGQRDVVESRTMDQATSTNNEILKALKQRLVIGLDEGDKATSANEPQAAQEQGLDEMVTHDE